MPEKTLHVLIEGRVQGVWFRAWTTAEAKGRALNGWVRNRSDGCVEALFSGPAADVDAMVEECWNGPPAANVDKVTACAAPFPVHTGFKGLPSK